MLTDIFGGSDSLLYKRLRNDLGLVYSAGFYQHYKWKAGFLKGYIGCKASRTRDALIETHNLMTALQTEIPEDIFDRKKLDTLNSFVFNVDSPFALADVYSRYHMRNEPIDTLDRIQDDFIQATRQELLSLARAYLDPGKMQIVVVADLETEVKGEDLETISLKEDLEIAASKLGLPVEHLDLR
jgi:predicted Zn-dependent peptidase